MMPWEPELAAVREAAEAAGEAALRYWRKPLVADTKSDLSPVTPADRECERIFVQHLCHHFPEDGLLGEEGAEKPSANGRRWIIDPIDGTRDFLRGNRLWAMLIALEQDGEVVLGLARFPAMGECYWATYGGGAFRDEQPIHVSKVTSVPESVLCIANCQSAVFSRSLTDWIKPFWAVRSLGGAADAMLVAGGSAEAWVEPCAKAWDLAALKVIAEEAGGRFFNFDGGASIYAGNGVICVPALETLLRRFVSA